jgi:hypothetical protein
MAGTNATYFEPELQPGERPVRENEMNTDLKTTLSGKTALFVLAGLLAIALGAIPATSFAGDGAPEFVFNDRCVPYQLTDEQMLLNGIDPTKILTTFGGTPNPTGGNAPWVIDYEADGVTPKPCDEFHTAKRRTRYIGCHFYDGTPCYTTTNGTMDQNAFTDDEAGRIAFEIAEHFVIYEVAQQLEEGPGVPPATFYFPIPIATDPFAGGFGVMTQTKIFNTGSSYWDVNPAGTWKLGFIQFTPKAFACRMDFVTPDCLFMNTMTANNGTSGQMLGYPLIYTGDEIFDLAERGLISLRYRIGANSGGGQPEGPRYILCPVHQFPDQGDISIPGGDIIQGYPTHIEFQVTSAMVVLPDFTDSRGHVRLSVAFPFGPTPPDGNPASPFAEKLVYDNFDCLQRTGNFCP